MGRLGRGGRAVARVNAISFFQVEDTASREGWRDRRREPSGTRSPDSWPFKGEGGSPHSGEAALSGRGSAPPRSDVIAKRSSDGEARGAAREIQGERANVSLDAEVDPRRPSRSVGAGRRLMLQFAQE